MSRAAGLMALFATACPADPWTFSGTLVRLVDYEQEVAEAPMQTIDRGGDIFDETQSDEYGSFELEVPAFSYHAVVANFDGMRTATTSFSESETSRPRGGIGEMDVHDSGTVTALHLAFQDCAHHRQKGGIIEGRVAVHPADHEASEEDLWYAGHEQFDVDIDGATACFARDERDRRIFAVFGLDEGWYTFTITPQDRPHRGQQTQFLAWVPHRGVARFDPALVLVD